MTKKTLTWTALRSDALRGEVFSEGDWEKLRAKCEAGMAGGWWMSHGQKNTRHRLRSQNRHLLDSRLQKLLPSQVAASEKLKATDRKE